jgi:hypothetical protein
MSNIFITFFKKIESWFTNPKVEAAFNTVASIIANGGVEAIVADINALVPNKTLAQVTAAYQKYGVPIATQINNDPTSIGNALLNLATTLVQKNIKNPVAVNLIQTAVQTVVTAVKAA